MEVLKLLAKRGELVDLVDKVCVHVCVCVRTDLSWSTETALSNWNAKARWASAVCVYTDVHTDTTQLPSSPHPPPTQLDFRWGPLNNPNDIIFRCIDVAIDRIFLHFRVHATL